MYNASDRKDVRRAEKAAKVSESLQIAFLRNCLSTVEGRAWFHDFLVSCHLFSDPFTGDALLEAYSKGERNVGLRVFAQIQLHTPDLYIVMMQEASHRNITNDGRNSDYSDGSAAGEYPGSTDPDGGDQGPDPIGADYDPYA